MQKLLWSVVLTCTAVASQLCRAEVLYAEDGGTRITHNYRVTGYYPEGLKGLAIGAGEGNRVNCPNVNLESAHESALDRYRPAHITDRRLRHHVSRRVSHCRLVCHRF